MKQQINDAFDSLCPDQAAKERMLHNILSASGSQPAGKDVTMRTFHKKRTLLVAAIVVIAIFMMGCAVALLNLYDLRIGEYTYVEPNHYDENGEKVYATEKTRDVISLQGIKGSANQKAAQEWFAFEQSYDPDHEILFVSDDFKAPSQYDAYFVYSQEMINKVDEITEKYGLKLAGPIALTQDYQQDIFFDALGLDGLTKPDAEIQVEDGSGYFYECGNFKLEFSLTMSGEETQWIHENLISYNYKDKAYFDTVYCTVEDIDAVTQWNYTLADGTELLIVNTGNAARIFCDREDAFISVGFDTAYMYDDGTEETMTNRDIELVAKALDFTVKPQKPNMAEAQKKIKETEEKWLTEQKAMMETWVNPFVHESYQDHAIAVLENSDSPENYYYTLIDLNGDGIDEMITGGKESFGTVYTIQDGKPHMLLSFGTDIGSYLCQDNIVEYQERFHDAPLHAYYRLNWDGYPVQIESVYYDAFGETWMHSRDGNEKTISEEQAYEIINSYTHIELDRKPITEFPMA